MEDLRTETIVNSPHFEEGSSLRRTFYGAAELRAGWRLLIFIGLAEVFILSGNAVVRAFFGNGGAVVFILHKVVDIFTFVLASWLMGRLEGRTLADYGLPWRLTFGVRFWQGMIVGFASLTVLLGVMRAVGVFHVTGAALHGADVWKWAGLYLVVFVIVGVAEEFKYRGYMLFTFSTGVGFWPAAAILSVLFGAGHISNTGETWIGAANAALGGLVFAGLLRRSGNLWLPIGFHTAWDWGQTYFYGVADSGITVPGHLYDSTFSGSVWLSGGTVGPEGSVLCTLALILIWLACSAWLRGVRYPSPESIQRHTAAASR